MFGYDDEELERIRRGGARLRLPVVVIEVLLAVVIAAPALVLDVLNDPVQLLRYARRAFPAAPFSFSFDEVEWLPVGAWHDPWSWRFAVTRFVFQPSDPIRPDWTLERATLATPEPMTQDGRWVAHLPEMRVVGLAIHAHQQRPPPPWEPTETFVHAVLADRVEIRGASFDAPPDPPLGPAGASGVTGTLTDLWFVPGAREVSGEGSVEVRSFTTGNITVTGGRLPVFRLDRSSLHIEGTYAFAGTTGSVDGDVRTFHVRSSVDMHAVIRGAGLGEVIRVATGDTSAIDGVLDLDLRILAGGERPRGSSLLYGGVQVRDGSVQLGRRTRYLVLDALDVLPWVDLDASNRVLLHEMSGDIEINRGSVTVKRWTYPAGKRTLQVDGRVGQGELYLFVRLLPRPRDDLWIDERPGLGLLMWGSRDEQQFRLATPEDLRREDPWVFVEPPQLLDEEPTRRRRKAPGRDGAPAASPSPATPPSPEADPGQPRKKARGRAQ